LEGIRWEYVLVLNPCAGISVGTTHIVEHVSVGLLIDARLDGTAQRVEHAAAKLLVGRGRKWGGGSSPSTVDSGAGGNAVGRRVRSTVDARWRNSRHGFAEVALHELLAVS